MSTRVTRSSVKKSLTMKKSSSTTKKPKIQQKVASSKKKTTGRSSTKKPTHTTSSADNGDSDSSSAGSNSSSKKKMLSKVVSSTKKGRKVATSLNQSLGLRSFEQLNGLSGVKTVVIGAGPVGLMTCWQLLRAGAHVHLYERRNEFERNQILWMESQFWDMLPPGVRKTLAKKGGMCQYGDNPLVCDVHDGKYVNILLRAFQDAMLHFLQNETFQSSFICSFTQDVSVSFIQKEHKTTRIVIVCDGGGRNSLLNELWRTTENSPLLTDQSTMNRVSPTPAATATKLKSQSRKSSAAMTIGTTETTSPFKSIHVSNAAVITFRAKCPKQLNQSNEEHLVNFLNGKHPQRAFVTYRALPDHGYIGIQLSDESYAILRDADMARGSPETTAQRLLETFKNKVPEGSIFGEVVKECGYTNLRDIAVNLFPIDLRTAKSFHYRISKHHFFVVGDAAFTTHFFTGTGMNRGFLVTTFLVDLLRQEKRAHHWVAPYIRFTESTRDQLWDGKIPPVLMDERAEIQSCLKQHSNSMGACLIAASRNGQQFADQNARTRLLQRQFS